MYVIIYTFVYLLTLMLTYAKFKTVKKVTVAFSTLWCICGCLSSFGLLGMRKPDVVVHVMVIIVVLVFTLSYVVMSKSSKNKTYENNSYVQKYIINYKLIYIINIFTLLLYIPYFIDALNLYKMGYSMGDVRYSALVTGEYSYYHKFFFRDLPSAINDSIIIFALIDTLVLKVRNKGLLIFALLNIASSLFAFGGRFILVKLIFITLSFYTIDDLRTQKISKKFLVLGLLLTIGVTIIRNKEGITVWNSFVLYYPGAFSFLDLIIENQSVYGLDDIPLFGQMMLGFIVSPIIMVLKVLLGVSWKTPSYYFNVYVQGRNNIGAVKPLYINNNTTMLFHALRDFGYLGVVIYPLFLAKILVYCENRYRNDNDIRYLAIYTFMFTVLMDSVIMYQMMTLGSAITFCMFYFFVKKQNTQF